MIDETTGNRIQAKLMRGAQNVKDRLICLTLAIALLAADQSTCVAATAGRPGGDDLVLAAGRKIRAVVVVSPEAGALEKRAADDLAKYIRLMCGGQPDVASTPNAVDAAMRGEAPVLVVGRQALDRRLELRDRLHAVLKKEPHLRTDGIVLSRKGNRVYLAGNHDAAHYFAVAELLRRWGCRWYMPTEFGECIPEVRDLRVGQLDYVYSSPFEIRSYWISWLGDRSGAEEFQLRNDYRFQWDVDLSGKLRAGTNTLALRCRCEHHYGGMFRRPFLYRATEK